MESYNRINGTHVSESKWLLTDILRGEWGYEGMVVSDWEAVNDRPASLLAGLDLEMPDSFGDGRTRIIEAVKDRAHIGGNAEHRGAADPELYFFLCAG